MSRDRFKSIMSFLHTDDLTTEDNPERRKDKLKKVRTLVDTIKAKCQELYQQEQNVSLDEER